MRGAGAGPRGSEEPHTHCRLPEQTASKLSSLPVQCAAHVALSSPAGWGRAQRGGSGGDTRGLSDSGFPGETGLEVTECRGLKGCGPR